MPHKDLDARRKYARDNARKNYQKNRLNRLAAHSKWRNKIKLQVIDYYSKGKMNCVCCGEDTLLFLTVDHINNNGSAERKKFTGGGHHNYRYIIKNNFPPGYQILCFNCNCGRSRTKNKICPHKINEKEE